MIKTKDIMIAQEQGLLPVNVIVLVGHPGAGKTSWANYYYPNYERISGDVHSTSSKVVKQLKSCLARKLNCIVDATNVTAKRRTDITSACRSSGHPVVLICVIIRVDIAVCKTRATERERLASMIAGSDVKHIPSIAFNTSKSRYAEPAVNEGFDQILEVFNV